MVKFKPVGFALSLALGTAAVLTGAGAAGAEALHGYCAPACPDNGHNSPTSANPPVFIFSAGGHAATGDVMIDILVPDNVTPPASYMLSGPFLGASTFTASLFSPTPWTSGDLDAYLGMSASPNNPIGAFIQPSGANGWLVFDADLGSRTLPSNSDAQTSPMMTTSPGLFQGSYIVAFQNGNATANSGAIREIGPTPPSIPEPATWAMLILGVAMIGAAARRRSAGAALAA